MNDQIKQEAEFAAMLAFSSFSNVKERALLRNGYSLGYYDAIKKTKLTMENKNQAMTNNRIKEAEEKIIKIMQDNHYWLDANEGRGTKIKMVDKVKVASMIAADLLAACEKCEAWVKDWEEHLSCHPKVELLMMAQEKLWIEFIEKWQPGEFNSGLGMALQNKFQQFKTHNNEHGNKG